MKNYIITFGTGKDKIRVEVSGIDIPTLLADMKNCGWQTENATSVKEIKK
jgi:hypothetical protein